MIRSYGLTHIALTVRDAERSLDFYQRVLGVIPVYRQSGFIQAQTPGIITGAFSDSDPGMSSCRIGISAWPC